MTRRRGVAAEIKNLISRVCAAVPYVLDHGNHDQMSPDGRVDVRLSREFSTPVPMADSRLKLRWFASDLLLLSTALHSDLLINHAAQVRYGGDTCEITKHSFNAVHFVGQDRDLSIHL